MLADLNNPKKSEETACPNWYAPTVAVNSSPYS